MSLRGTVMLITGASSGIGAATARRAAAAGARVALAARSADQLDELAVTIRKNGGEAVSLPADVTRDAEVTRLVEATIARFGRLDVLVNNAGFAVLDHVADASLADFEEMLAVNLVGAARCAKAVLPQMLAQRRGQIVNIASMAGLLSMHNFGFYCATKAGLIALTRSMQLDLSGTGVRCVAICPGTVRTPFFRRAGIAKLPRTPYLIPWLADDDVARTILRAVERRAEGEICVPGYVHGLLRLANASPSLARLILRVVR
jgi:uncharacterized protein